MIVDLHCTPAKENFPHFLLYFCLLMRERDVTLAAYAMLYVAFLEDMGLGS